MDHHVEQIDAMASHVAKEMVRPLDQQTSDTNFLDMKATPSRTRLSFFSGGILRATKPFGREQVNAEGRTP
jgi:hypothetical protein